MIVASHTQHASGLAGSASAGTEPLPVSYTHKQSHAQQLHNKYIKVTQGVSIQRPALAILYYTRVLAMTTLLCYDCKDSCVSSR
jgi:hypothetical protein